MRHFRSIGWNPKLFDRTYCDHTGGNASGDKAVLDRADRTWRELVAGQAPVDLDRNFVAELDRIVAAARKELLA